MLTNTNYFKTISAIILTTFLISIAWINGASAVSLSPNTFHAGPISSINKNWILSGQWMGIFNKTTPADRGFFSVFNMVMINGSAPHVHKIYNATFDSVTHKGSQTILDGFASVTMKNGPINNVPLQIVIANNNTIAISLDPIKTKDHFGTPIYGQVSNFKEKLKIFKTMFTDPEMKNWILVKIANMVQNIKDFKAKHSGNHSGILSLLPMLAAHKNMNSSNSDGSGILSLLPMLAAHKNMNSSNSDGSGILSLLPMLAAHKNMNSSSDDILSHMREMHGAGANGNDSNSFYHIYQCSIAKCFHNTNPFLNIIIILTNYYLSSNT